MLIWTAGRGQCLDGILPVRMQEVVRADRSTIYGFTAAGRLASIDYSLPIFLWLYNLRMEGVGIF